MRQLKQLQKSAQYDLHVENEELRRQLKAARDDAERKPAVATDSFSMGQYHAAVEARLTAEAHALSLQDELAAAHARHQTRENELTVALDRVKKAKRELECRYEGVDLAKIADETTRVRELQDELTRVKTEAERARASLQKKLDWYVENQQLLDAQDDELERLKAEVKELSAARPPVARPQSAGTPSKSPVRRSPADVRRISELEHRIVAMEDALRRRHPDSLVTLLLASRKAEEDATLAAMKEDFQQQLQAKDSDLEQLHATSETTLKSFRQQQEKLVLLFQRRIREQEQQLQHAHHGSRSTRAGGGALTLKRGAGVVPKPPTDDDEVARVRRFYTEKIKELEKKWDAKYRALRKQQPGGGGGGASNRELHGLSYADSTTVIMNLQRQLREREAAVKKLSAHVSAFEVARGADEEPVEKLETDSRPAVESPPLSVKHRELSAYVRNVEAQLKASEEARAHLVQTLSTLHTHAAAQDEPQCRTDTSASQREKSAQEVARAQQEIAALTEAHRLELRQATDRVACLEQHVRDQRDEKEAALKTLATEKQRHEHRAVAAEQALRPLQELADRVPFLEHDVAQLREQLAVPRTPSMVQYRSLELKIETLMQKHVLREAELKVLLAKATQSSELEKLQMARVHESAIAAKNVELRHFKKQLDVILWELEQLRQPHAAAP